MKSKGSFQGCLAVTQTLSTALSIKQRFMKFIQVPSGVAIYVNTQVVPFDSQGNTAGVTTNQALDYRFYPTCNQRGLSLLDLTLFCEDSRLVMKHIFV